MPVIASLDQQTASEIDRDVESPIFDDDDGDYNVDDGRLIGAAAADGNRMSQVVDVDAEVSPSDLSRNGSQ